MPLTPEQREQIVDLAKLGRDRNEIARAIGCSPTTVTKVAKANNVAFDGSASEVATKAKIADARKRRVELELLDDLGDSRVKAAEYREFGTARDFQSAAQAFNALMRSYVDLIKNEPEQDQLIEARGLLGGFFAAVSAAANPLPEDMA